MISKSRIKIGIGLICNDLPSFANYELSLLNPNNTRQIGVLKDFVIGIY
jgi:hypothetical protein